MFCWDNLNKQKLEVISITWMENEIVTIRAKKIGIDILKDGFYKFQGKDLNHIALVGTIEFNRRLLNPNANTWTI